MIRIQREGGGVTVTSRLGRARVLGVLLVVLVGLGAASGIPEVAAALALTALLLVVLGGRAVRAHLAQGRVRVRPAVPFQRETERPLAEFRAAAVETVADARRRKADRLARQYAARSGAELPSWLRPPQTPGANDHLRRIVLVPRGDGEPVGVTAWLPDDLEPARAELDALLR